MPVLLIGQRSAGSSALAPVSLRGLRAGVVAGDLAPKGRALCRCPFGAQALARGEGVSTLGARFGSQGILWPFLGWVGAPRVQITNWAGSNRVISGKSSK